MSKTLQYFDIDLPINDKRSLLGLKLNNGIKMVLVSDPDIKTSSCSIGVNAGYLQDKFEGTAHFLEHLLFMGSKKFPEQNTYHSYVQTCGGIDNAFTGDDITCYFLELETEFMDKGIEMLSWFFREPLLDMKHINSEREIINSEHQKNILSDTWIMDDIFKKFIEKSKYSNFGTGNSESLKSITKEDILNFYDTYYTTDNLFVCIVDTKDIATMKLTYLKYFEEIPKKTYDGELDRFLKVDLKLIDENLIIFKSISQYNFLNFYIIIKCEKYNQINYQLINLISHIIGCEYEKSFSYYLKENNIASFIRTSTEYYYDYEAIININITLTNSDIKNLDKICIYLNSLLNVMSKISNSEFTTIYENYRKINLLQLLYNNKMGASEVSNGIIENMTKGEDALCVIRKNAVPEYNINIYKKYLKLLNDIEIKITSNLNIEKRKDELYSVSEHYKTKYYITIYDCSTIDSDIDYDINNLIIYSDITIKSDMPILAIDKNEFPTLIFKSDIREIYLLKYNKYEKPMMNITIIRKNSSFINKKNSLIIGIYNNLCMKILNYYLDTISNYKMSFIMSISDEYLVLNFNGLDYIMNKFINYIVNKISFYSIQLNPTSKKYFDEIKKDIKDSLLNLKYNSPYSLCLKYFSIILSKDFMPEEAIKYIDKLTYDDFISQIDKLLVFEKEYFIIIGNLKNCPDGFLCDDSSVKNALNYVDILTLNPLRYKSAITKLIRMDDVVDDDMEEKNIYTDFNYVLEKSQINPNEVNNCLIDCYLVKQYKLEMLYESIKLEQLKLIFKDKLIYGLISDLINEPLFDKIRTIDKLGYIVKSVLQYHAYKATSIIVLCYVIQSNYKIDDIYKSVNEFNKNFYKDFKHNNSKFQKMFETLKKSKILDLQKNPADLDEEMSIYLSSIVNKYGIFSYINEHLEILKTITFEDLNGYMEDLFSFVIKTNRHHVILNKNI